MSAAARQTLNLDSGLQIRIFVRGNIYGRQHATTL